MACLSWTSIYRQLIPQTGSQRSAKMTRFFIEMDTQMLHGSRRCKQCGAEGNSVVDVVNADGLLGSHHPHHQLSYCSPELDPLKCAAGFPLCIIPAVALSLLLESTDSLPKKFLEEVRCRDLESKDLLPEVIPLGCASWSALVVLVCVNVAVAMPVAVVAAIDSPDYALDCPPKSLEIRGLTIASGHHMYLDTNVCKFSKDTVKAPSAQQEHDYRFVHCIIQKEWVTNQSSFLGPVSSLPCASPRSHS
ncbi:uncharacterized protein DS421_3g89740 [Arachis hypogaea]|nr:uncharacterized protein DS421_3g89740 [Arachis hypogaea]